MLAELISAMNLNGWLCLEIKKISNSDIIILLENKVASMYLGWKKEGKKCSKKKLILFVLYFWTAYKPRLLSCLHQSLKTNFRKAPEKGNT